MRHLKVLMSAVTMLFACAFNPFSGDAYAATPTRNWHEQITHALPKTSGCFIATYPDSTFKSVTCGTPPKKAYALWPTKSSMPRAIELKARAANDYALAAPSPMLIKSATGSFPVVTDVTAGTDYTLQINSKQFSGATSACNGVSGCTIWQQFIYDETNAIVLMEYWLFDYGTSCPTGWNSLGSACWMNSPTVAAPAVPAAALGKVKMSAFANKNGYDIVQFEYDDIVYLLSQPATVLSLDQVWKEASFNVYGNPYTNMIAEFNRGAFLGVRLEADYGNLPTCVAGVFTGESNNLTKDDCVAGGGSIQFDEYVPSFDFTYPVTGQTVKLDAPGVIYVTGVAAPAAAVAVVSVFEDPARPFCTTRANASGQWVCNLKVDTTASYLLEASEDVDQGGAISDYFCVEVAGQGRCNIRRKSK